MTVFVDTSALVAALDRTEGRHGEASAAWHDLVGSNELLLTTNYVLLEAYAVVQRRLGIEASRKLETEFRPYLEIDWIDPDLHDAATSALLAAGRRRLSLVDCTSFEVMRRRGLRRVLTLDADFASQGFEVLPQPAPA